MSKYCSCPSPNILKYPLHEAIYKNDINEVKKLINNDNIESRDCGYNTPLMVSLKCKYTEIAVYLIIINLKSVF